MAALLGPSWKSRQPRMCQYCQRMFSNKFNLKQVTRLRNHHHQSIFFTEIFGIKLSHHYDSLSKLRPSLCFSTY